MQILVTKLPPSGWWSTGIPKYEDNPAMRKGAVPDLKILNEERDQLLKIIKKEGINILELDFPTEFDQEKPLHDFVFIRDPFISNQKGKIVILRSGELLRRRENYLAKNILEKMGFNPESIPDKPGIRADGGEFYFCSKGDILFAGIQRNTREGISAVASLLNVKKLLILDGLGYHLDTFFTPAYNDEGFLVALIVCTEILSNQSKKDLYKFADNENIPIFIIPPNDAIGTKNKPGNFAVNALPLPGLLIRPHKFTDPTIDEKLSKIGVDCIITPVSQFQLSGGSIHCVTNEL